MIDNILFFDTETTGIIPKKLHCVDHCTLFPHIVQLSWSFNDKERDFIIKPNGWTIPPDATKVHKITTEKALKDGVPFMDAFKQFYIDLDDADVIVAHNAKFDIQMLVSEYTRTSDIKKGYKFFFELINKPCIDTMLNTIDFVGACFPDGTVGKYPKLEELYYKLFQSSFNAHNSMDDVRALQKCFYELKKTRSSILSN